MIIFLTCAGCGWGVGTFGAGLLPGVGWILASFIISMPRPNGSVIITASAAGEWYLYGGAIACVARLPGHVLHPGQALSTASLKRSSPTTAHRG